MTAKPQPKQTRLPAYFQDKGADTKKYVLIREVYFERVDRAKKLIATDPEQINAQDPHSGLTPLHIAIFRQNEELVALLAQHPQIDLSIKDNFQRRIVDMLDYTTNRMIFETVIDAAYPEDMRELTDEAYEAGRGDNVVVPIKPQPKKT